MKVAIVFVLLFATVLCRPVSFIRLNSGSTFVRRPARPVIRKQQNVLSKSRSAPVQVKSVLNPDADTDEEESDSDSESGESSTPVPVTVTPTPGVVEPETTQEAIEPTVVTDPDAGRGDSLGGYTDDYKSIMYVEEKSYQKGSNPYKSYEIVGKKVAYDMTNGNEVEKFPKLYKALQIHSDIVEEDTSTPEVETQGLDASSGLSQDQDASARQAAVPAEDDSASSGASTANDSESSSTPEEEEEEEGASSPSDSASAESEDTQSSEEATATPGAADSDSDEDDSVESDSDEDGAGPNPTDTPVVVTAK
uniref:Secreted phosphoprotein 1 n=1 Tax=Poecilia latipinna TaxID=48699 RepID=A0A3B3UTN4_9TELE